MALPAIQANELVLDNEEAHRILNYLLLGQVSISADALTEEDRLLAQQLAVEAIERHYEMGFVQALFQSTAQVPKGPAAVFKAFLKKAAQHWFTHATQDDLAEFQREMKLYQSVVNVLASRWRSVWAIREQTGMLIY